VNASSLQRKQGAEVLKTRKIRVAVVTEEALVRGFVTAIGWLGVNTSAFSWGNLKAALAFLEIDGAAAERALEAIAKVRSDLDTTHTSGWTR
jgi:hypothetical protein